MFYYLHTYSIVLFLKTIHSHAITSCISLPKHYPSLFSYLPSPSSSLLYSAISISRRVLMSSSILYSWLWFSMSARNCINCSSRPVTCIWRLWSCMEYRASVSAKVPSRAAFCRREEKQRGMVRRETMNTLKNTVGVSNFVCNFAEGGISKECTECKSDE